MTSRKIFTSPSIIASRSPAIMKQIEKKKKKKISQHKTAEAQQEEQRTRNETCAGALVRGAARDRRRGGHGTRRRHLSVRRRRAPEQSALDRADPSYALEETGEVLVVEDVRLVGLQKAGGGPCQMRVYA